MEYGDAKLTISPPLGDIQDIIQKPSNREKKYTLHFNQNEEFFIQFSEPLTVSSLPIHHPFHRKEPTEAYRQGIRRVIEEFHHLAGPITEGLTYYFDPRDHLRPAFYKLYRAGEQHYVYLLRIDLTYHPSRHQVLEAGTNDLSPTYQTDRLIVESDFIPLESIEVKEDKTRILSVSQTVSETWIGETGRGYFVQGIWLDRELTKFFSKLFIPKGKRLYPYYPFTCKYRAVCHSVAFLDSEGRKKFLSVVHRGREFLMAHSRKIEAELKSSEFSEDLPLYRELYDKVPAQWRQPFEEIQVRLYLNDNDMREYEISYEPA